MRACVCACFHVRANALVSVYAHSFLTIYFCGNMCVCVSVSVCVCVCVCACVRVCVRAYRFVCILDHENMLNILAV